MLQVDQTVCNISLITANTCYKSNPVTQTSMIQIADLSELRGKWWSRSGSNRRPPQCHCGALPTELRPRKRFKLGNLPICDKVQSTVVKSIKRKVVSWEGE